MNWFKKRNISNGLSLIDGAESTGSTELSPSRGRVISTGFDPEEASISAIVIRCGCGKSYSHPNSVCPQGIEIDLGVVSYFNVDPKKQALWEASVNEI